MAKGKRIIGEARSKLVADITKDYKGGASIRAIAEAHGRSYGFVHKVLTESGVPMRRRGGDTRKPSA